MNTRDVAENDAPAVSRRRGIAWVARLAISAGIIAYLIGTRVSVDRVGGEIGDAIPGLLLLAFTLHLVGFALSAVRWRLLLAAVGRAPSLLLLMRAYLIGMFCNQFLPSTVGGDVYRGLDAAALTGLPRGRSLAIVVVERLIGAAALFSYAVAALILGFGRLIDKPGVAMSVGLLALGFAGVVAALTPWSRVRLRRLLGVLPLKKVLPSLDLAFGAVKDLGGRKRVLAGAFLISLVFQLNVILHYVLVGLALGLPLPLEAYFLVVPVVLLILQLPLSLNGIGLREAVFIAFLGAALWGDRGATENQAFSYSVVVYAMILVQGLLGGVFFALRGRAVGRLDSES